ncbi:hypothetical protein [Serratia sp. CY76391]|uniref:hypothetical protein n=1 Tax=Serratia sp. CY76391 TaxID=3383681 RepID=UPI003F9F4071
MRYVISTLNNGGCDVETTIEFKGIIFNKKHKYKASVDQRITSPSGRWLLINFSRHPSEDDDRLVLFDIRSGKVVFSLADFHYSYNESFSFCYNEEFIICHTEVCDLTIDLNGNVVNERVFYEECVNQSMRINEYVINKFIDFYGDTQENRQKAIHAIDGSLKYASLIRLKAELFERCGDWSGALSSYKEALSLDCNVGVKRKIQKLSKVVGNG